MEKEIQISAVVSRTTKSMLEQHARASGIKKGRLVEDALRHHLLALEALPPDAIIHPRLVVTADSGKTILSQIETGKPNARLRDLMRDGD